MFKQLPKLSGKQIIGILASIVVSVCSGLVCSAQANSSSYSNSSSGSKVFFLFLQDLGYQVTRIFDLEEMSQKNRMLILLGPEKSLPADNILQWVAQGNRLLLALPLAIKHEYCGDLKFGSLPISRIHRIPSSAAFHPTLNIHPSKCLINAPVRSSILAGNSQGALALESAYGKGKLMIVAFPELLSNENLGDDNFIVLIRRWINKQIPAGSQIAFLEEKGDIISALGSTNLILLIIQGLLWIIFLYWSVAPRFGDAPEISFSRKRRNFADHARALGRLYQTHRASSFLLNQQYKRLIRRITQQGNQKAARLFSPVLTKEKDQEKANRMRLISDRTGLRPITVQKILIKIERAGNAPLFNKEEEMKSHLFLSQMLMRINLHFKR